MRLVDVGVAARCDARAGRVAIRVRRDDERAISIGTHLFFSLCLLEILRRHERYPLHAAGVALEARAVLVAGASGAGKSTIALACVKAGWDFLGDDVVLLRGGALAQLEIHAFPDEIDLTPETLRMFQGLGPAAPGNQKTHVRPLDVAWLKIAPHAVPAVIVFPERSAGRSRLLPMSADDALVALVPHIVRTDPAVVQRHLDAIATLARSVPAFRLEIADPFDAPRLLAPLSARLDGV
jgi:hypothetical protein